MRSIRLGFRLCIVGTRGGQLGLRQIDGALLRFIAQFDEQIALMHSLVVRHIYCADDGCHLRAKRSKVAANVSIVGHLFDLAAFPGIPATRDGDQDRQSKKHHENGC